MGLVKTTTIDGYKAERISRNLFMLTGKTAYTSYLTPGSTTAITEITSKFKTVLCVIPTGGTGYTVMWDATYNSFKCYKSESTEADADDNIGTIYWIAIGRL